MPTLQQRFRRITDLFVQGKAIKLPDDSYLWVQALNAFERDEAVNDAQVARSRMVMALQRDGKERMKVEARLAEIGKDSMADDLAIAKASAKTPDFAEEMRADPEWKERMEMVLRTDWDNAAKPPTDEEKALLEKANEEVMVEFDKRESDEKDFLTRTYLKMTDEDFLSEWIEQWIDMRGGELATAEFRLTEVWYATRYCDAAPRKGSEDVLDHAACNGHQMKVFETKADARSAPQELLEMLRQALDEINLSGRDPKDSDSPESSSDSSPPPSEAGE